jgi:glycosyltransferase involved in cell wall biosynthesis
VTPTTTPGRKLLFFVTEDYYFVSHRLPLALAAKAAGYDVSVVTRVGECGDIITRSGLRLIPFDNARSSVNPVADIPRLVRLALLYRRERPDIVHHVAMKPVLYGSLAALISARSHVINALAGMGWLFTSGRGLARWLKPAVRRVLGLAVSRGIALVQNADDAQLVAELGVPPSRIRQVAGSGVDIHRFQPRPEADGVPVVVMHARLLWDKGVGEYVAAARLLRQRGIAVRFLLAGEPDPANPASIPPVQISHWATDGSIDYLGYVEDVPGLLATSHIVCLPSHREGLPKSLIEAAASGRAIVTTDVPGCRAVVRHGDNGLLVPVRNAEALADALGRLINEPHLRQMMGVRGRERAEREFALDVVIGQTLALYREVAG